MKIKSSFFHINNNNNDYGMADKKELFQNKEKERKKEREHAKNLIQR